jgi:hypothetical protein
MDRPVPRPDSATAGEEGVPAADAVAVDGAEGAEFLEKYNAHRAARRRQREAAAQWRAANGMVQAPKPTRAEARAMNLHFRARNFAAKFGEDMAAAAVAANAGAANADSASATNPAENPGLEE